MGMYTKNPSDSTFPKAYYLRGGYQINVIPELDSLDPTR